MKVRYSVGLLVLNLILIKSPHAEIIFSQDFSSFPNGPVSAYVSSSPNSGQWNTINWSSGASGAITDGAMSFTRNGSGTGWFARTTGFNPIPDTMIYSFDLTVSGNVVAQSTAATFSVGSGFTTGSSVETTGSVFSRFAVNMGSSPGTFQVRDLVNSTSADFSGTQTITWVINNSGAALTYLTPNATSSTLEDNAWDLWVGTSSVFHNAPATSSGQVLSNTKFVYNAGYGTIKMDNFSIRKVQPVPEPAATGALAAAFLAIVILGSKIRSARPRLIRKRPSTLPSNCP